MQMEEKIWQANGYRQELFEMNLFKHIKNKIKYIYGYRKILST